MKKYILFLGLVYLPFLVVGQQQARNTGGALLTKFEYGFNLPGGDLADRFGSGFGIGTGVEWLTDKGNWSISLDYSIFFSRKVKEDPLASIRNSAGLFIGTNRSLADIGLRQRGFYAGGSIGKIFSMIKDNPRSGIKVALGLGLFQHRIRIQEDPEASVPILRGDYTKGFDRLSNGLSLRQFIGYQHLAPNRLANFYAGIELTQAFTQDRRDYDFETRQKIEVKRIDLMYGFKVGWILPFYLGQKSEEIFY